MGCDGIDSTLRCAIMCLSNSFCTESNYRTTYESKNRNKGREKAQKDPVWRDSRVEEVIKYNKRLLNTIQKVKFCVK